MHAADAARVAWYRFRRTLRRRWGGYLSLALLLGLLGGLAMGSVAAARRTQAAFPAYLASTDPSDLTVLTGLNGVAGSRGYDPAVITKIAALPQVRHVATYLGLNAAVLAPGGGPGAAQTSGTQGLSGSVAAGTVVGVPLGIALGRYLWDLFAGQIGVVPEPSVPGRTVVLVVLGALVAANLVAALPGRAAARTPAAALLRAE